MPEQSPSPSGQALSPAEVREGVQELARTVVPRAATDCWVPPTHSGTHKHMPSLCSLSDRDAGVEGHFATFELRKFSTLL